MNKQALHFPFVLLLALSLLWAGCAAPAPAIAPAAAPAAEEAYPPAAAPAAEQAAAPAAEEAAPPGTYNVAILVVDDFEQPLCNLSDDANCLFTALNQLAGEPCSEYSKECAQALVETIKAGLDGENCAVTPYGQGHFTRTGAQIGGGAQAVPHGQLVYEKLEELRAKDGISSVQSDWVSTFGYTTKSISDNLRNKIDQLSPSFDRFVINMSFVLMPCGEVLKNYGAYLDELALADQGEMDLKTVLNDILVDQQKVLAECYANGTCPAYSPGDPLYGYLKEKAFTGQFIAVGAAGNEGAYYPYAPAIWDNVVSASAKPDSAGSSYSNWGEVQLEGVLDSYLAGQTVLGTSFSAPELSYEEALYLSTGRSSTCSYNGITTIPPLKYRPNPSDGAYEDLTLEQASGQYCPGFPVPR